MSVLEAFCGKGIRQYGPVFRFSSRFLSLLMVFSLTGCKTLKSGSEAQENTTALKAVSDVQYILRLAPYQTQDSSLFVFEVCQKGSADQGCAIAFQSPSRQPVVFTAREIGEHQQSAMEAFAKLIRDNPGASSAAIVGTGVAVAGAGAAVARSVAYHMMPTDPDGFVFPTHLNDHKSVIADLEKQGINTFDEAMDALNAKEKHIMRGLRSDNLGKYEIKGDRIVLQKSDKLQALLAAQSTSTTYRHVFKQSFVDFLKSQYAAELAANNTTAEEVLRLPLSHLARYSPEHQPKIDWGLLIDKYHAQFSSSAPSLKEAAKSSVPRLEVFDDLIHPDALDDLKVLQNWGHATRDFGDDMLEDFLYHAMKLAGDIDNNPALVSIAPREVVAFNKLRRELRQEVVLPKQRLKELFTDAAGFRAIKQQLLEADRAPGKISQQIADNKGIRKKLVKTAKKRTAAIVVIASVMAGGGVAHVLGVGQDKTEQSIDRAQPSLFEVGSEGHSPVDSVQGIVVQLGEYLKASGTDIAYFCMPSGCASLP